jgi:hypothetical protein
VASFSEGCRTLDADQSVIEWFGFGRALRNPIRRQPASMYAAAQPL